MQRFKEMTLGNSFQSLHRRIFTGFVKEPDLLNNFNRLYSKVFFSLKDILE